MFYNKKNILLIMSSCLLAFAANTLKAQGLVSLSEEAMFDDGLETSPEVPDIEAKKPNEAAVPVPITAPAPASVEPKAATPNVISAPKANVFEDNSLSSDIEDSAAINLFGNSSDDDALIDKDLFTQMSELEKRTALLNLELRREKLQNEIEAVKDQRRQAIQQEKDRIEEQRLKNLKLEKEQEQKVLVEQQKLRDLDIQFEKLRQEKVLTAYKNQMLEENQRWIEHNANFYKQIAALQQSKKDLISENKKKMETLQKEALEASKAYNKTIENHKREVRDLQSQISVLRNRIKTVEQENEEMKKNPFANADGTVSTRVDELVSEKSGKFDDEPVETDLSKLYAVTEIRGQGNELIAKLINKNGTTFYVKKGTALQSGHIIGDITTTYVTAEKDGSPTYLYFAAGGIVPVETTGFELEAQSQDAANKKETAIAAPVAGSL